MRKSVFLQGTVRMAARVKTWDNGVQRGGSLRYGSPFFSTILAGDSVGERGRVEDFEGNRTGSNPFSLSRITEHFPLLNGQTPAAPAPYFAKFEQFPVGARVNGIKDPRSHFGTPSIAVLNELAWTILSRTNPSKAHVGLPAALGELKDLPSLVRGWGRELIRDTRRAKSPTREFLKTSAKANLSWKFGLAPMLGDIKKLFQFTSAVNKRLKYLRSLRDGKTLRTRCFLGSTVETIDHGRALMHSQGALLYARSVTTLSYEMWGTAEWKLLDTSDLPDLDDAEMKFLAQRLVLGITTHGALEAAWELLPWSWFVDWFSNVGEMLTATNNSVGCTWGRINVMRHSLSERRYTFDPVGSATWPTFNGWFDVRHERKDRYPTYPIVPVPLPRLPTIDGGKLSILLSLAALRR